MCKSEHAQRAHRQRAAVCWLVVLITCASLPSCGQDGRPGQVAWDVSFGCAQDAENAATVSLRILGGGCGGTSALYDARVTRTDLAPAPPDLAKGDYGFEATAYDAGDTVLASACVERSLPRTERVQIVLTSQTVSCSSAADGGADSGAADVDAAVEMGCGDRDQDGCDDCAYSSSPDPAADGPEFNGDGQCDCVVFADASIVGAGDGKRWATAFSRLQDAIDSAADQGDACEVWVRQGTYYSFVKSSADGVLLRRGIDLYGGFAGGELMRGQRSSDPSLTVIDGRSADSASLRVSHVLTGASDVLVEGFTIVGGDAAGAGDAGKGGGMFNFEADLTLRNLRFRASTTLDLTL